MQGKTPQQAMEEALLKSGKVVYDTGSTWTAISEEVIRNLPEGWHLIDARKGQDYVDFKVTVELEGLEKAQRMLKALAVLSGKE